MSELFFRNTPQLETERLLLRKLVIEDAEDIFEYASDDEVTKFMSFDTHKFIEDAKRFINVTLDQYRRDEAGDWGIILKETGKLIGSMGFPWVDKKNSRAEIGYVLGRRYWGKGIMPEAVRRLLEFAFNDMELNRIECVHAVPNEKSGRVMQKAGMTFEGIARERMFAKGKYWDVKQYAILRSDSRQDNFLLSRT
ncbi:MAG TPA: GNAT family protein [Methylomusa anaerophila]|uniref:Putative ribosomal N-acetyltransferase YdaF n=1 Tax=Methylomusa anaerophila TaxID=1930071 RepID=A0A348AEP0_9FIRM|nr:GNAT family protein [Methylomusa anaerophila]BBB89538.1 putative ribosomal N-acetyltransferase YdaF [Methylomusa anaerophila]HML90092.1 GNAT family protein [Methylomusa anaerophila]